MVPLIPQLMVLIVMLKIVPQVMFMVDSLKLLPLEQGSIMVLEQKVMELPLDSHMVYTAKRRIVQ